MAKSVELSNGRAWKTKKAATEHFKDMLSRYKNGDEITDFDDHKDLSALLERFDALIADGPSKIGSGIQRFERRLNKSDGWASPGFWVVRTDATATDFSYVNAVSGMMKPLSQEFYAACHNAVSADLIRLKQNQYDHFGGAEGKIECDVTGTLLLFSEAELSHVAPLFVDIVSSFREMKGWKDKIPLGILTQSQDAQLSTHFADKTVATEFQVYHHSVAVVRITAKSMPAGARLMAVKHPLRFTP